MWPREWVEVKLYSSMSTALEWGKWSATRPGRTLLPGKDLVPILQETGWAPGPDWTGGKSRPHRNSIPNRPARSQSQYQLPGPPYDKISVEIRKSIMTRVCIVREKVEFCPKQALQANQQLRFHRTECENYWNRPMPIFQCNAVELFS